MSVSNTLRSALPMSIYTVLRGEHKEVDALFKAAQKSPDPFEEKLFEKIYVELLSHARAEQSTVYDRARQKLSPKEVHEAEREHAEVESLLMKMKDMNSTSSTWDEHLEQLIKCVKHHVREEEEVMFQHMKSVFSDKEAKEMGSNFHEAKERERESIKNELR